MKNYKIDELHELLNEWFKSTDLSARNIFNQNKIAKLIKKKLKDNGNWKDKPRGKPNTIENLNKGKIIKKEVKNYSSPYINILNKKVNNDEDAF